MHLLHYAGTVRDTPEQNPLTDTLAALRAELDEVEPTAPDEAVHHLSRARTLLDTALDEAMALATLSGASVRSVALTAGVAPNTVAPRLARTAALGAYQAAGRVGSAGIERARHDQEEGRYAPAPQPGEPLRFRRRQD
jgi:hypothetical protein